MIHLKYHVFPKMMEFVTFLSTAAVMIAIFTVTIFVLKTSFAAYIQVHFRQDY